MPDMPLEEAWATGSAFDEPPAYILPAEDHAEGRLYYEIVPENCPQTREDEIVVCADRRIDKQVRLQPIQGEIFPDADDYDQMHIKLGPVEMGSFRNPDGTYGFGARLKF